MKEATTYEETASRAARLRLDPVELRALELRQPWTGGRRCGEPVLVSEVLDVFAYRDVHVTFEEDFTHGPERALELARSGMAPSRSLDP